MRWLKKLLISKKKKKKRKKKKLWWIQKDCFAESDAEESNNNKIGTKRCWLLNKNYVYMQQVNNKSDLWFPYSCQISIPNIAFFVVRYFDMIFRIYSVFLSSFSDSLLDLFCIRCSHLRTSTSLDILTRTSKLSTIINCLGWVCPLTFGWNIYFLA